MNSTANADVGQRPGFATLSQFRELVSAFRRRMGWHLLLFLAGFLALFAIGIVLGDVVNRANVPTNSPLRFLLTAGIFGPIFIGLAVMVWSAERLSPKCPHCLHAIALGVASRHIIVTRRCPKCAQPLFEDELPNASEAREAAMPTLLRRTELTTAQELANRSIPRRMFLWLIPGMLVLVAGSLMDAWVQQLLASQLSEVWLPFVRPALLIPGYVVLAWSFVSMYRRAKSAQVLCPCPHCSAMISAGGLASRTGNCQTCGQPAIGDPVPGMQPPLPSQNVPRWKVAEFRELAKYRRDRLWIGCLFGPVLAVSVLIPIYGDAVASFGEAATYFFAMGVILPVQIGGVWLWHRYSARGLHCPECRHELLESYRLAVSSHRCYHCGSTVLRHEGSLEQ